MGSRPRLIVANEWKLSAILFFLSSLCFLTIEATAARALGGRIPAMQMALVRSVGAALVFVPFVIQSGGRVYYTRQLPLHLVRGTLSVVGLWCYFVVFANLPLAEATTITYSQVLFLTFFATVLLGEAVSVVRWSATLVGLVGVALVMRPGFEVYGGAYVVALLSAVLGAALYAVTKVLTANDTPLTVMIYVATMTLGAYVLPGVAVWRHPSFDEAILLLVIGTFGPLGQYLGIRAFELAEASFLAPFDYLRVVFAVLVGVALFGEFPDFWVLIGTMVIVLSALLIAVGAGREDIVVEERNARGT
jgi:drug/metabolite transporter (DMT)-like permease